MCEKKSRDSPAILILAGVAFSDAGVLVLLLLLGVTPFRGGEYITTVTHNIFPAINYVLKFKTCGNTWHGLLIMVLEPTE